MKYLILSAVLLASLVGSVYASTQPAVVEVTGGEIEGEKGGDISCYKGIPFAAPPVGPLRWKPPQPVQPWAGVRKTTQFAPGPMQRRFIAALLGVPGNFSEDCLYLNVWTPAINATQKLPVMVWIYGGAFIFGSTAQKVYDGTHLAEKGVVVVSVAYRVGAFGFLAHPELTREGCKGNFGIRDQIAGLEWVRDNIAAFGGDPKQVTIFGESAGGQSVGLLVTSPKARGLFQRAIAESGALAPQKALEAAEKEGVAFLAKLKVKDIAAARLLPARDILDASTVGSACCDDELFAPDPFEWVQDGRANDTPILIGFNSDDGGLFVWGNKKPYEFTNNVCKLFGGDTEKVVALYPHANTKEATHASKDLARDVGFAWPVWNWARIQAARGSNPAFVYVFDQHSSFWQPDGARHAAELEYVFNNVRNPGSAEAVLADRMSSYWVNFAKTGNPNGAGLPEWQAFTTINRDFMYFGGEPRMAPMLGLSRIEALDPCFARFWKTGSNQ